MAGIAMRRTLRLVALAGLWAGTAAAQDFIKPGEETFTLNLGGIVNQFDTSLRLDGNTTRGTPINLESNGLGKTRSSFVADATWRFTPRNRIDLQYFSTSRSGSRDYTKEISIGDTTFPIGATVDIDAKDRFLLANYRYSFLKSDEVELAGLVGIYGGRFEFDVDATGHEHPDPLTYRSTASTTVPLPLIGGTVDWYVNPRWKVSAGVSGLKAHIGDVDGTAIVAAASTDYMLMRNLGIGVRYMYTDVDVDVSRSNFHGNATWRMNSVSLYAKVMF
jgi:hypothetical protein